MSTNPTTIADTVYRIVETRTNIGTVTTVTLYRTDYATRRVVADIVGRDIPAEWIAGKRYRVLY